MRLDIHEIIAAPGTVPYEYEADISDMKFPGVLCALSPLTAKGSVVNSAGVISLTGEACVRLSCMCDRCGEKFTLDKRIPLSVTLADELQDEENPDIFLIDGNSADLDEIMLTAFVLSMESKLLCKPGCLGLCDSCGANLNDGPCSCERGGDPRLAGLAKLLEQQE